MSADSSKILATAAGLTALALLALGCPNTVQVTDVPSSPLDREQLWNFVTTGDPAANQPAGQLPADPFYAGWSLFPGPADNPDEFLNKRLGLPVHGRWVTVFANSIAVEYVSSYLESIGQAGGEVPPADLPVGSIIVKVNFPNVPAAGVIRQALQPAVLTIAYKPEEGFCQTGVTYNGTDCLGGDWMWAFYGLQGMIDSVTLPRQNQDVPVGQNTQAFCVNCHDPGSRTDYMRGLQRLAEVAAHDAGPISDPAPVPTPPVDADPFCDTLALSPEIPADVALDPAGIADPAMRQTMFDCFSWRTFIALNWPALPDQRGEPDTSRPFGENASGTDTVWETYKATWEVFQPENPEWDPTQPGNPAGEWNSPRVLPPECPADTSLPVLANVSKTASRFPDVVNESGQAFAGSFGTLTDRNGQRVRYQVLFNETSFDFFVPHAATRLLSPSGPDNGRRTDVPDGAIEVKSSWKVLCTKESCKPVDEPELYYSRDVLFYDVAKATCEPATVGLTGLHVIAKTFWAPQWIWATFEHRLNAPTRPEQGSPAEADSVNYSFYDPSCSPEPGAFLFPACSAQPFLAPKSVPGNDGPVPVGDFCCSNLELNRFNGPGFGSQPNQVTRLIPAGGSGLNTRFKDLISAETGGESPFSNYLLVNTQWPFNGRRPADAEGNLYVNRRLCPSQQDVASDPLRPAGPFPSDCYAQIPTFLRNTSMETYMQTYVEDAHGDVFQVSNRSCMGCHASGNDFSYIWLDAVEQVVCVDDPANGCECQDVDGRFQLVCDSSG